MRLFSAALALFVLAGCHRPSAPGAPDGSALPADAGVATRAAGPRTAAGVPAQVLAPCPAALGDYLEQAGRHYDAGRFTEALACAAQAAGADPSNPDTHAERAAALVALGMLEEARVAYARALALDPDHIDALMGAADLYIARLPFSRELAELGLAYAHRGRTAANDRALAGQFASLAATALNGLGRASEAAEMADQALAAGVDLEEARYEKASALWELCRFDEARKELGKLAKSPGHAAHAHYYLGLIAERDGDAAIAAREMQKARTLDPEAFPVEPQVSSEAFAQTVAAAAAALPDEMKRDVQGVPISTQDLPDLDDLIDSDPPLSPTIVGLFRGPPLGEPCPEPEEEPGPCRSIVLYRLNMIRSVKDSEELKRQIEVTLYHEIGHLRGEDDTQLVARGLE